MEYTTEHQWIAENYPLHYQRICEIKHEQGCSFFDWRPSGLSYLFFFRPTAEGYDYWRNLCGSAP